MLGMLSFNPHPRVGGDRNKLYWFSVRVQSIAWLPIILFISGDNKQKTASNYAYFRGFVREPAGVFCKIEVRAWLKDKRSFRVVGFIGPKVFHTSFPITSEIVDAQGIRMLIDFLA